MKEYIRIEKGKLTVEYKTSWSYQTDKFLHMLYYILHPLDKIQLLRGANFQVRCDLGVIEFR